MIGRTIAQYRITAELGRGGMGVVYRAEDIRLRRDVAMKLLPPGTARESRAKERFLQEARAASSFDHPNICTIYEIGETDEGELYLVMPVYEGGTLRDRMLPGPMAPEEAIGYARQIAQGLERAHSAGIVHRDVKPDNLMVVDGGRIKILDFGVAKLSEGADLTAETSTLGTAAYMSPEQARGEEVDGRSDLWALGVILYEALSGEKPFPGSYDQAVIYGILNTDVEPLESVPDAVAELVHRLLQKDAADRPSSAGEVDSVLAELASGSQTAISATRTSTARVSPGVLAGVAAAVVLGIAAVLLFGRGESAIVPDPAIAVLPFEIQGSNDLEYLANGIPSLLSAAIDGMGSLRAVDPKSVRSVLGDDPVSDEARAAVAREFNALGTISGSVIQLGGRVRLQAVFHDNQGNPDPTREVEAESEDGLTESIDRLARELIADRFSDRGQDLTTLSAITSPSFEALRRYLDAEALIEAQEFQQAYYALTEAIDADSTFAMAFYRRAALTGWFNVGDIETERADILAAARHGADLPQRARLLISASRAHAFDSVYVARSRWREIVRRFPDDSHALFKLGDNLLHYNRNIGQSDRAAFPILRQALRLDPANAEARFHLEEFAIMERDWEALDSLAGEPSQVMQLLREYAQGGESLDTLFARLFEIPDGRSDWVGIANFARPALLPSLWARTVDTMAAGNLGRTRQAIYYEVLEGRVRAAEARLEGISQQFGVPMVSLLSISPLFYYPGFQRFNEVPLPPFVSDPYPRAVRVAAVSNEAEIGTLLDSLSTDSERTRERVEALLLWSKGDRSAALALLERWQVEENLERVEKIDRELLMDGALDWSIWLRAELLFEAGRLDEAARWFRSLHGLPTRSGPALLYIAPAHRRLGDIAWAQGDEAEALRQYSQFLGYWKDPDPELLPAVEEARQRVDQILDRRTEERGS